MVIIGYVFALLMGLILGVVGGGGSILTVPILVYFFEKSTAEATATSLVIVGLAAFVGSVINVKSGLIDLRRSLPFAIPSFAAVLITRRMILPRIPEHLWDFAGVHFTKSTFLMSLFALLMLWASIKMIGSSTQFKEAPPISPQQKSRLAFQGVFIGLATGFTGAGGGFLIVPALVLNLGFTMKEAVGTSFLIITLNSLVGVISDLSLGVPYDLGVLSTILIMALIGMSVGLKLGSRLSEINLKKGFGWFVLAMGSLIFLDQLSKI